MRHHISILIPTHNRASDLRITLDQMTRLESGAFSFEIVVIDNNSSDDTQSVLRSFERRLPLRTLFEPQPGKNRALNAALDAASLGDVLVFTDDDVTPDPEWLRAIVSTCDRWPEHSLFGGKIEVVWPSDELPSWVNDPSIRGFAFSVHDYAAEECLYEGRSVPFGPNYWVRREVFDKGRRFDARMGPRPKNRIIGDETLFLRELLAEGYRIVYTPHAIVKHRLQPTIVTREGIVERAHIFGRTIPYLLGIPNRALLDRNPWMWWLNRHTLLLRDRLRYVASLTLSTPSRRMPRAVLRLRDISHHREAMRLVREGNLPEPPKRRKPL